jgi:hypothetical protein
MRTAQRGEGDTEQSGAQRDAFVCAQGAAERVPAVRRVERGVDFCARRRVATATGSYTDYSGNVHSCKSSRRLMNLRTAQAEYSSVLLIVGEDRAHVARRVKTLLTNAG